MLTCEDFPDLVPCALCIERHLLQQILPALAEFDCHIQLFKECIDDFGFEAAIEDVTDHPYLKIYLQVAVKSYFPEFEDRMDKLILIC